MPNNLPLQADYGTPRDEQESTIAMRLLQAKDPKEQNYWKGWQFMQDLVKKHGYSKAVDDLYNKKQYHQQLAQYGNPDELAEAFYWND